MSDGGRIKFAIVGSLLFLLSWMASPGHCACTPYGASCIPDSALYCRPWAQDPEAQDCEFANGLWRITQGTRVTHGTGTDHTLYWADGCEVPYMTIDQPMQNWQVIQQVNSKMIREATSARVDGSEHFDLASWGSLELWPGEKRVRDGWASVAPVTDSARVYLTIKPGAGRTFVMWYVREEHWGACAGKGLWQ